MSKLIQMIQIVGPCTGIEDYNFPLMNSVEVRLRAAGYIVTNPARVYETVRAGRTEEPSWREMMNACLIMLIHQHAIIRLPGWESSKGARLESYVARELGIQILEWEDFEKHLNKQII